MCISNGLGWGGRLLPRKQVIALGLGGPRGLTNKTEVHLGLNRVVWIPIFSHLWSHFALSQDLLIGVRALILAGTMWGLSRERAQASQGSPLKTGHLEQRREHWHQRLTREVGLREVEQSQGTNLWVPSTGKGALAFYNREIKTIRAIKINLSAPWRESGHRGWGSLLRVRWPVGNIGSNYFGSRW